MARAGILVVDDDPLFLLRVAKDLSTDGHRVKTAGDGKGALERLTEETFDLVITDLKMTPVGGIDVLQRVKSRDPDTGVIILTGYGDMASVSDAFRHAADDFILKSCQVEELLFRVDQVLEKLDLRRKVRRAEADLRRVNDSLERTVARRTAALTEAHAELKRSHRRLLREHAQRKALSGRLMELLEKDRRFVAGELHDHIGQTLTSLKILLESAEEGGSEAPGEVASVLGEARRKAARALTDLKSVFQGLRPAMLDHLGLAAALRDLAEEMGRRSGVRIRLFARNIPREFTGDRALALYRITQEAVNNAVKHARAGNIHINLIRKGKRISLGIEDDGVGFSLRSRTADISRRKSLGLVIMRERAIQFDGEFTLESGKGKGTLILVEMSMGPGDSPKEAPDGGDADRHRR